MKFVNYHKWYLMQRCFAEPCPVCKGIGVYKNDSCYSCDGTGLHGLTVDDYEKQVEKDKLLLWDYQKKKLLQFNECGLLYSRNHSKGILK